MSKTATNMAFVAFPLHLDTFHPLSFSTGNHHQHQRVITTRWCIICSSTGNYQLCRPQPPPTSHFDLLVGLTSSDPPKNRNQFNKGEQPASPSTSSNEPAMGLHKTLKSVPPKMATCECHIASGSGANLVYLLLKFY